MKKVHKKVLLIAKTGDMLQLRIPPIGEGTGDLQNMLAVIFAVANTELYISHKLILITYKKTLWYVR
jgi:hypothetical protein